MSLIIIFLLGADGWDSILQAAPSSGLRRGKHGISSAEEVVEAPMALDMSLSGILPLTILIMSSSTKKDCNEALHMAIHLECDE